MWATTMRSGRKHDNRDLDREIDRPAVMVEPDALMPDTLTSLSASAATSRMPASTTVATSPARTKPP